LLRDALDVAARLEALVADAASVVPVVAPVADSFNQENIDIAATTAGDETDTVEVDLAGATTPAAPAQPVDIPTRLAELLLARNKIAAAILRTCELRHNGTAVVVVAPAVTITRLREHANDVRAAAAECGVALTISVSTPPEASV
jgi:hypothetical protein